MASSSKSTAAAPSAGTLRREISIFLRAAADPNALTFKQVRLAVEKSLGLPEGSLHKGFKSQIKEAVHSVMDEIEADGAKTAANEEEEEEEEEEFVDDTTRSVAPAPSHGCNSRSKDTDDGSTIPKSSPTKRKVATGSRGEEDASGEKHSNRNRGTETGAAGSGKEVEMKEGKKQKKNIRNTAGEDDGDETLVCVLGETKSARKQVNVRIWNKRILVDIREFYLKEAKEYKPGKKGMSLNPSQWEILRSAAGQIDENIRRLA
ncbi:unnamed protein product [Ectocarpus fasciculatus]